jgi:acetyl-CoA carboxylase carboxyl transferase subunit beta
MRLAEELGLPLVTVIDTPGAELSVAAEEGAIAGEIARCIATLTTMTVPTVSVILGQGCGGGALALLPAQVVVATENAWLSPLPPEGASVIRFGDLDHAAQMAESQGIGSAALVASGIVDRVVAELPEDGPESLAIAVAATVANELVRLVSAANSG